MKLSRAEISILVFGAAFLALLAAFFRPGRRVASERSRLVQTVPASGDAGEPTALLSGFDYTESVGDKPLFRIRSDRTVGYGAGAGLPPNRYALERVALTVYPEDGPPVTVQADRAQYDDRTKAAILSGNVRWADPQDGALGETEKLEFDPTKRILRAPMPLHFARGTFDARASRGSYDVKSRVLSLSGPIQGSGTGQGSSGLSEISAESGEYRREEGIVELASHVTATSAKGDRISCDRLLLKFSLEGNRLEWARAYGSVRGTIGSGGSRSGGRTYSADEGILYFDPAGDARAINLVGTPASIAEPKQQLAARSIDLDIAGGRPVSARASGEVRLHSDRGDAESQRASASFAGNGDFQTLELEGDVRLEGEGRKGSANRVVDLPDRGVWILTGNAERTATVEENDSKVSADRIEIDRNRSSLRAEGKARAVFVPQKDRPAEASSLLGDPSRPAYGKGDRIVLDRETRLATLSGGASLWQDASSLFADDITLNDSEKSAVAVGKVRAVLVSADASSGAKARKGKEEPATITARRLIYRESEATAVFEDGVSVIRGSWRATGARGVAR
ncbi:MAG TPA: LPS export ABC transporter periplasmic protein LptC, partial [Thermoanaerobaculia bacterium]|nr:LPS export ABC transporter periplasmic protein LptC [Thermoanaerobaculia bacterium]